MSDTNQIEAALSLVVDDVSSIFGDAGMIAMNAVMFFEQDTSSIRFNYVTPDYESHTFRLEALRGDFKKA